MKNKIPEHWRKVSYPSQWNLTKYLQDLQVRIEFFRKWIKDGKVEPFWIGGMFFPQSFLTSVLQNFARKNTLTVEQVTKQLILTVTPCIFSNPPHASKGGG